ncbi:MAG TPA: TetR/AcrR family transcriptional regulator [Terriglobales bacterium]|jgi:AcrR family transcriptional regulator|nr:TetR/AcrR family transcriptional regulator [Terriglobales bacterium]
MVRTASDTRPTELLDAIVAYLVQHGVAELSLRPLAQAVNSSPRVLLYYFGSKEELIVKALGRLREKQRGTFSVMREARYDRPSDSCRAIWNQMTSPQSERLFQFFFETYALGLRHPKRFGDFLHHAVEDWIEFIAAPAIRRGQTSDQARAFATIVIAGFRGFMLDYCASHDRPRIDRAVDLWLHSLDTIPSPLPETSHA